VTLRTQTLLMVISLLAAAVLATVAALGWSSRQSLLAETEAEGAVIARLLARGAGFGAHVTRDVEDAVGRPRQPGLREVDHRARQPRPLAGWACLSGGARGYDDESCCDDAYGAHRSRA